MKVISIGFKGDKTINITLNNDELENFIDHVQQGKIYQSKKAPNMIWIDMKQVIFMVVSEPQEVKENGTEQPVQD